MGEDMSILTRTRYRTESRSDPESWPLERKVALVLEGLRGERPIAAICREAGISTSRFYQWRDRFIKAGGAGIARTEVEACKLQERIHELEAENAALRAEKEILKSVAIED